MALEAGLGRITAVRELGGVPIGAYDVKLDSGQLESNVPMLLPASSHLFRGQSREFGASGIVPIASVGDSCIVIYVGARVGLAQPFILGFFAPRRPDGTDYPNPKRVRPGSLCLTTPFGNGILLRNGGIIEIEADAGVRRVMTPAVPGSTDLVSSMIADQCRNYRLQTAAGEVRMGEFGGGRSGMRFRVQEFSLYSKTKASRVSSGGGADRFVEVVWGSAGSGALARETYSGSGGSVVLTQDGRGGWDIQADQSITAGVGAVVRISAMATGEIEVDALSEVHRVVGQLLIETSVFMVQAPLIALNGVVVIGGGGLPSARIMDTVLVGERTGEIITGQPNLIH